MHIIEAYFMPLEDVFVNFTARVFEGLQRRPICCCVLKLAFIPESSVTRPNGILEVLDQIFVSAPQVKVVTSISDC